MNQQHFGVLSLMLALPVWPGPDLSCQENRNIEYKVVSLAGGRTKEFRDGPIEEAGFQGPVAIGVSKNGVIYVGDGNHYIRRLSLEGVLATIANKGVLSYTAYGGYKDGPLDQARFGGVTGLATDSAGNVFVSDNANCSLRRIGLDGHVTTVAGSGPSPNDKSEESKGGYKDGVAHEALFRDPAGLTVDPMGNIYVADYGNNRIRRITPAGHVTTMAGSGLIVGEIETLLDLAARLSERIPLRESEQVVLMKLAKSGVRYEELKGTIDGIRQLRHGYKPDEKLRIVQRATYKDGPANEARFHKPTGLAIDANGNIFVTDSYNNRVRRISPDGQVFTVAGSSKLGHRDGKVSGAQFNLPTGVAVDGKGDVFVVDNRNNCIRKISPDGFVSTIAGSGRYGHKDGIGKEAEFSNPVSIAIDNEGNLYVADNGNKAIRKIIPMHVSESKR